MAIEDFYNRRCVIFRVDRSERDAVGGIVPKEIEIVRDERCCISEASLNERAMHGSSGIEVSHKLFVSAALEGRIDETMRVRSTHKFVEQEFEIKTIKNPQYKNHHLLVMLLETKGSGAER